jgi:hypothetical protein
MATTYAVRLRAQDEQGGPADIADIADSVGRWARVHNPVRNHEQPGHRGGTVTTEVLGTPGDALWAWRLRVQHAGQTDPGVLWTVQVAAVTGATTDVDIRLGRSLVSGRLQPSKDEPAPPGCIRTLLGADRLVFKDGGRRLTNDVWVVEADNASELADLVLSPDRRLPVFGITLRDHDALDGGMLMPKVAGLAHVAIIRTDASWQLDRVLPRGLNVYGGAARLWWPGAGPQSSRWDHDLWTGSVAAHTVESEAVSLIVGAGLAAAVYDPRLLQLERDQRNARNNRLLAELALVRSEYEAALKLATEPGSAVDEAATAEAGARLQEVENRTIETLQEERDTALDLAVSYEQERNDARQRASIAERERDYLRAEVASLRAAGGAAAGGENSDEKALLAEIEAELESRGDLDGAQTRTFALGPVFAATVIQHGDQYRAKAVKACADVVSGSTQRLAKRQDHKLRTGSGGDDPARTRTRDGATARRCYIEHKTAAARRLHYWVLPDASIELASINVHDDMDIPE